MFKNLNDLCTCQGFVFVSLLLMMNYDDDDDDDKNEDDDEDNESFLWNG